MKKVALVTGVASGIGRATAEKLLSELVDRLEKRFLPVNEA